MHLSVTTGNSDFWEGERDSLGSRNPECLTSPETGLLPGHSTQQRVAVGNRASVERFCIRVHRLSFSIAIAALRVSTWRYTLKRNNSTHAFKLAVLGIAIASSLSVHAEEAKSLDTIQVTANRSEVSVEKTLASVTVITRSDIERSQAPDVAALLGQQAGLDILRSGGTGANISVFTRGSNSNHTLILINGIRVNTVMQGSYDFSNLPVAMIERVEIVRGPRAALWGSDAIGGVINIFTREKNSFAEFRAGSYGRAEFDAGFGYGNEENNFGAAFGYGTADGFSATNSGFYPDDDGFRNSHLLLNGKLAIGTHSLGAFVTAIDAHSDFDEGETDRKSREVGVALKGKITDSWQHSVTISHSYDRLETPAFDSVIGNRRLGFDWINTIDVNGQNRINVGVNWSQESGFSEDLGFSSIDETRRNAGLFAAWRGEFERNTFELAARHDDNSQFGSKTTGQAAWGFEISDAARLRASWGQGFRAPNFNELYYPGFFGFFAGYAGLRPETSDSAELGFTFDIGDRQTLEVSAYRTNVTDLIAFEGDNFSAVNVDHARLKGVEVEYKFKAEDFSLTANGGWQDARDLDDDHKLLRRADRKLNINADFKINDQWDWGVDFQAASKRPDFGLNYSPGYGRVDARLAFHFANAWTLEARVENLGDKDYELIPGYNTPGRSGMVTLRWNGNR